MKLGTATNSKGPSVFFYKLGLDELPISAKVSTCYLWLNTLLKPGTQLDMSGFIAVLDKDDASHTEAAITWMDILTSEEDLVTTNYVLVETCALVQNRLGMRAIKVFQEDIEPVLRIVWIDKDVHQAAMRIMRVAARKKLSLVDCVSFETMRLLGVTTAFTLDRHFKEQGFICLLASSKAGMDRNPVAPRRG